MTATTPDANPDPMPGGDTDHPGETPPEVQPDEGGDVDTPAAPPEVQPDQGDVDMPEAPDEMPSIDPAPQTMLPPD